MVKDKLILCVFDYVVDYSDKEQGVVKDCNIRGCKVEKKFKYVLFITVII